MRYRKKPPIVDAFQYGVDRRPSWMLPYENSSPGIQNVCCIIPSANGDMKAKVGDYIVRDEQGDVYPIPSDVFLLQYEKIIES